MKKILLVRHALPEHGSATISDKQRRLKPEGVQQAQQLGKYLSAKGITPDLILCSDAARTQETASNLGFENTKVELNSEIYLPSADQIMTAINDVFDEGVKTLMIMTHYPGVLEFALDIAGDRPIFDRGYPESTLSIFETSAESWQDVTKENTKITHVRMFKPLQSGNAPRP